MDLHRPLPLVWSGGLDSQKGAHVSHKPFQKWAPLKLKFTHGGSHTLSFTLQQWEQNPTQIIGNTRMQGSRIFLFLQLLGRQHRGGWAAWPSTSYMESEHSRRRDGALAGGRDHGRRFSLMLLKRRDTRWALKRMVLLFSSSTEAKGNSLTLVYSLWLPFCDLCWLSGLLGISFNVFKNIELESENT